MGFAVSTKAKDKRKRLPPKDQRSHLVMSVYHLKRDHDDSWAGIPLVREYATKETARICDAVFVADQVPAALALKKRMFLPQLSNSRRSAKKIRSIGIEWDGDVTAERAAAVLVLASSCRWLYANTSYSDFKKDDPPAVDYSQRIVDEVMSDAPLRKWLSAPENAADAVGFAVNAANLGVWDRASPSEAANTLLAMGFDPFPLGVPDGFVPDRGYPAVGMRCGVSGEEAAKACLKSGYSMADIGPEPLIAAVSDGKSLSDDFMENLILPMYEIRYSMKSHSPSVWSGVRNVDLSSLFRPESWWTEKPVSEKFGSQFSSRLEAIVSALIGLQTETRVGLDKKVQDHFHHDGLRIMEATGAMDAIRGLEATGDRRLSIVVDGMSGLNERLRENIIWTAETSPMQKWFKEKGLDFGKFAHDLGASMATIPSGRGKGAHWGGYADGMLRKACSVILDRACLAADYSAANGIMVALLADPDNRAPWGDNLEVSVRTAVGDVSGNEKKVGRRVGLTTPGFTQRPPAPLAKMFLGWLADGAPGASPERACSLMEGFLRRGWDNNFPPFAVGALRSMCASALGGVMGEHTKEGHYLWDLPEAQEFLSMREFGQTYSLRSVNERAISAAPSGKSLRRLT